MIRIPPILFASILLLLAAPARAQDNPCGDLDTFPCQPQIEGVPLVRVAPMMRLQARVAQAKLPVHDGLFEKLFVKVLRGTEMVCKEEHRDVRVKGSVLNLVIGPEMSCDLNEVVARWSNLSLQLCLQDEQNCLDPMPLGTVPAAIKSTWAEVARKAHRVQVAAQAHNAHRLTADADLGSDRQLEVGYLQVQRPDSAAVAPLTPFLIAEGSSPAETIAVLSYTPVRKATARSLHLAGRKRGTGKLRALRSLRLEASETYVLGDLRLRSGATSRGLRVLSEGAVIWADLEIEGALTVTGGLSVTGGGLQVKGPVAIQGDLEVGRELRTSRGITVHGAAPTDSGQPPSSAVTGDTSIVGDLKAHGRLLAEVRSASVGGDLTSEGPLATGKTVHLGEDFRLRADGTKLVLEGRPGARVRLGSGLRALAGASFPTDGVHHVYVGGAACYLGLKETRYGQCVDLDECATGRASCPEHSTCLNTDGGYECPCKEGCEPDGAGACRPQGE